MRKITLGLAAVVLAAGGTGVALADHHGGKRGMMGADTDGDGAVSLAEAKAKSAERFAKMDVNSDGAINEADREARRAARFAETDANGDGELTMEEMAAAREARKAERAERGEERRAQRFARLDTDGNGALSEAELEAGKEKRGEMRGEKRGKRGDRSAKRGRGGKKGGAMRMLRQADANGDKSVTRAEFDAAVEARFAKADADKSGTITAEEAKAARKNMKQRRGGKGRGNAGA